MQFKFRYVYHDITIPTHPLTYRNWLISQRYV